MFTNPGCAAGQLTENRLLVEVASGREIVAANWLNHSIRGFLSAQITNKMGLKLESEKVDGERRYRLPA